MSRMGAISFQDRGIWEKKRKKLQVLFPEPSCVPSHELGTPSRCLINPQRKHTMYDYHPSFADEETSSEGLGVHRYTPKKHWSENSMQGFPLCPRLALPPPDSRWQDVKFPSCICHLPQQVMSSSVRGSQEGDGRRETELSPWLVLNVLELADAQLNEGRQWMENPMSE